MSRQVARVETAEQRAEQLLATLESMHVRLATLFLTPMSGEEHLLQHFRHV